MTGVPTQLMGDEETYLATTRKAIGRRIDDEQHELFVVCDPAEALLQQFQHHTPDFIALHDLGLDGSLRLLGGVARATRGKLQRLVVRRQGFGVPLATLQFAELPGPDSAPRVRLYSTQVEVGDESQRTELAKALLGHSRLGVILVGPGAAAQIAARLQPLIDAMKEAGWRNRHLLWLPIGPNAVSLPPSALNSGHGAVQVHSVPPSPDLAQAWPLISALWDQLRAGGPVAASRPEPLPMRPMPATRPVQVSDDSTDTGLWREYVRACAAIPGMISCCVFEIATQRPLAHAGSRPGAAALAARGAALFDALCKTGRALGLDPGQPDLALTLADHHLLLHPFPQYPGLLLHAVLDAHVANLTLVRMKLHRLDPGEDPAP